MKPRWIFAMGALVLFVGVIRSHAQWSTDPTINNAICTATISQYSPTIVSDGAGGAIITWWEYRSGSYTSDIYAQRINASGVVQWTADGVAICTATNLQRYPTIVSDGAGGAIITWEDGRNGYSDIYAQRLNASGVAQWTADGAAICTATNYQDSPTMVNDGAGGAIITWQDRRSSIEDIYAQRINAAGAVQWTADGVAICTMPYSQNLPTIASDGAGGAIITWWDGDIYAQRINAAGVVQWTTDGVAICTATNSQYYPTIVGDDAGGAIITWWDDRGTYSDIYLQRVNAVGVMQWPADGVAICTATNLQRYPTIVSDGAGGAIVTWQDRRSSIDDIYAQRINAAGVVQWTADGVAICTATNDQYSPTLVSDGTGGAIITWQDRRNSIDDIYAQRVRSDGTLGDNFMPLADAGSVQTVIVNETVQLDGSGSSDPDGDPITYSWEITSKPAGSNAALSNPSIVNPTFVADVAGEYRVSLTVNDGTVNSSPDEVLITVITAQDAVQNLIDQVLALNKPQGDGLIGKLNVVIDRLDDNRIAKAIEMLQNFIAQVEHFIDNGTFMEGEGRPLINAANAIIAALSNSAQTAAAGIKKDAGEGFAASNSGLPTEFQLAQNSPNPFNPTTTIQSSVPRESFVQLKVYNSFGAEVATLVEQQVAAGTYKINWNASHLASGIYLYRLEAEGFVAAMRLLLMK